MQGIQYQLSIPKYIFTKLYNIIGRGKFPPLFPSIVYRNDLPTPVLNGANWVKLKSLMSGICGSDISLAKAMDAFSMEPYASFPCILGHENVSEVVELGTGVTDLKVGDRVVVNPVMGCKVRDYKDECPFCAQGLDALCDNFANDDHLGPGITLGYHKATGGGWSEYFQAHKWQIHKISPDIPLKRAILTDPFSSALQPVAEYAAGKKEDKTVFIYGAGTVGLLVVAAIRALELPWKIVLGYRYGFQGEMGKKLGADHIVKTGSGLYQKVCSITGGKIRKVSVGKPVVDGGFDAIFDCVGSAGTLDDSLRLVKTKGSVIMVATSTTLNGIDPSPIWFREVNLVGTCMSRDVIDPRDGIKKSTYSLVISILEELAIEDMVTHTFDIASYKMAFKKAMVKGQDSVIKVAFDLTSTSH